MVNDEDAYNDFLIGLFENLSHDIKDHMKKCNYCSKKTAPMLKECYNIMIGPTTKMFAIIDIVTLSIGTHMGLDPSKFPGAAK